MEPIRIPPVDRAAQALAREKMDGLIKPLGSLGRLEDITVRLAGATGTVGGPVGKTRVIVFAADNGVHAEGITPVPQAVTAVQTANMMKGICGINVLCAHSGSELTVVDVGVAADMTGTGVVDRKVLPGTGNMAQGPAMTREQALEALEIGRALAHQAADEGVELLGVGEMGICNTSTSAAVLATLTGASLSEVVGRGAGIDDEGLAHKRETIARALWVNEPNPDDPLDVLAKVGGLDIAAMAGCYLGAAERRLPAVVDGFIAVTAALAASRIDPAVEPYLLGSHCSPEPGFAVAAAHLHIGAFLDLGMRLGEGTGCPLAFGVIGAAVRLLNDMGTFAQGNIDEGNLVNNRV